ncbi:MAG TPA: protein kinase [Kofleriaceae bacterium]|nr:protein kinase [Kofleriaceae bacterium]
MAEAHSFGRYRVTGTLGAGGMGEVYAAIDDVLGREVAVKTLRGKQSGLAARMLDDRFRQEARAIAALAHPGVVQVFDIDLKADPPYIVMERVVGPSMKERLAKGRLSTSEIRALGIQIARALAAAHASGIVHRDVKPANILIAGDSMWKLADFGVAHVPESSITMTGQFVGSPAYAPPEALVRGQTSPAGDVYGLGATLYEAAAGRWPRAEETSGALFAPVPPIQRFAPELPVEVATAIDRAVAVEPDARPSATELADALAGAVVIPTPRPGELTVDLRGTSRVGPVVTAAAPPARAQTSPTGYEATALSLGQLPAVGYDETIGVPAAQPVKLPKPPAPARTPMPAWKKYAAIGGALLAVVVTIAVIQGKASGKSPPAGAATTPTPTLPIAGSAPVPSEPADDIPEEDLPPPGQIRAIPPQGLDPRAAREWNKIMEKLYRHDFDEARKKLAEFEQRYGELHETKYLRKQLDRLPEQPQED